jgi:hypothetical protein
MAGRTAVPVPATLREMARLSQNGWLFVAYAG